MYIRHWLVTGILLLIGLGIGGWSARQDATEAAPVPRPAGPAAPAVPGCWGVVPSPNTGTMENDLSKVAVVNASDVWAVGSAVNESRITQVLTQHWNGTTWSIIPTALTDTSGSLNDVAALAPNDVWAVGTHSRRTTMALHWNGSAWSEIPTPIGLDWTEAGFNSVTMRAPNDVWAVGYFYIPGNNGHRTLIEHWNGTAWSIVPSPNNYDRDNDLNAVTAVAANDVWAVGTFVVSVDRTLIEHWDGTAWTIVPSPNANTYFNYLYDVAAINANDIWAVGSYIASGGPPQTLILHWNGAIWSIIPSPNTGPGANELYGVAARVGTDVWAVGFAATGTTLFTQHWDGANWSLVAGVGAPITNYLFGVAVVDANQVWAVGAANANGIPDRTLTVRYDYPCITPSPVPATATPTATNTPLPTPTPHAGQFEDVPPGSTFYDYVECMGTRQILSGYPCGGPGEPCVGPVNKPYFRPNNNVTRGQTAKIVSNAAGWNEQSTFQHFTDVPPGSTFWIYVERAYDHGIINGYPCGGPGEPCQPGNPAYFRPNNPVTRGQTAKIVALAAQFSETPAAQTFEDVPSGSTFYPWVEQMAGRGIIGGYPCGGAGEPCQPPGNRPYYRPNNNVTRGQTAKIVTNTFFPNCQDPSPTATTTPFPAPPTVTPTPEPPTATSTPGTRLQR